MNKMLFNKRELRKMLPRKSRKKKKPVRREVKWERVLSILIEGGSIRPRVRLNEKEEWAVSDAFGSAKMYIHHRTFAALERRKLIVYSTEQGRRYTANMSQLTQLAI